MTLMRCKLCCLPTLRPDTAFHDGICSACTNHAKRPQIDWKSREADMIRILENSKNGTGYHCVVPSSAGKDSFYQALRIRELGFRPLLVTAATCMLSQVGRKNLDCLAQYATTIEVTPNREVRRKLNRLSFELVGDCSWPEHASIFSVPFRIAADLGIPTVWYGENPQFHYGSPPGHEEARAMTRRWVGEHAGLLGLRPSDFVGMEGLTEADMADYTLPGDDKLEKVTAYWLGQFEEWSSYRNAEVARNHGMIQEMPTPANWWEFENQDGILVGLHDHGMYRKYGQGRLCAQISVDIRHGKISREDAMQVIKERDGLFPWMYMGVPVQAAADHMGMTLEQVFAAFDKHTNWDLFSHVEEGRPILKEFAC